MADLEEVEIVPDSVTNFHFVNDEEEPISFCMLPLQWGKNERPKGSDIRVFLHGTTDDGLLPIFENVIAWTFDLSYVQPEIYVLSNEEVWIKLDKPRKSYQNTIKTVLVAINCLYFMKRHPGDSGEAIWNKMQKTFSTFDVPPHENDLFKHIPLLNKAAEMDKDIAKSEYLATLVLLTSGKRKYFLDGSAKLQYDAERSIHPRDWDDFSPDSTQHFPDAQMEKRVRAIGLQNDAERSIHPRDWDNLSPDSTCPSPDAQMEKRDSGLQNDAERSPIDWDDLSPDSTWPSADDEMEKRMDALIEKATSSFNQEEFINNKRKSFGTYSEKFVVEENSIVGVEASVGAARAAFKKLQEGCTVEEAKAVCDPEILNKITRWKGELGFYLAPFLLGSSYIPFGRCFTKLNKLKEVVNRLRWYVEDGDTIVDFCCGSNDFSCLMKEELDKLGKNCSFKNFDLIEPKKDFNFEKRDWMTVHEGELPSGSNLIMGLNPPFDFQASLANEFINKALTFKPKLLILIIPEETERLDKERCPYDLVWEDDALLSGKFDQSFYLPGSLDANNQQVEQQNWRPPSLFLWSRRDWTTKHQATAREHGHINAERGVMHAMG